MKTIIDFIDHLECPLVNGIIFSDGVIQILDISVDYKYPINYTINIGSKTSIFDLSVNEDLFWSSCAIIVNLIDQKFSIEIIAGEASYGSDGFVGIIDLNSKKIIWLAFFDCSNPFSELKIIGEEIHAISTLGCTWKFNIKNPVDCIVECL